MADPTKPAGRGRTIKVRPGSALDRLTEGRNFTETVHDVFEMYARAIGDQPVEPEVATAPQEAFQAPPEGRRAKDYETMAEAAEEAGMRFAVPDPDTGLIVEVGYAEAMRLMKLQCPAGLEPVLDAFMIQTEGGDERAEDELTERYLDEAREQEPFDYEQLA